MIGTHRPEETALHPRGTHKLPGDVYQSAVCSRRGKGFCVAFPRPRRRAATKREKWMSEGASDGQRGGGGAIIGGSEHASPACVAQTAL